MLPLNRFANVLLVMYSMALLLSIEPQLSGEVRASGWKPLEY